MPMKREAVGGHDMDEMVAVVTCSRCKEAKPRSDFGADARKLNGLSSWCKPCCSFAAGRYAKNNRERVESQRRARRAAWSDERREEERASRRRRSKERSQELVAWRRQYFYGLSMDDYQLLMQKQKGACAICGTEEPGGRRGWNVDHDHRTGRVRGILCVSCNLALGGFKDNPDVLRSAIAYLGEP